ncbi:MAG: ATP-binding protein, partial [Candidatus Thermoplasmatota archaeon]
MLKQLPSQYADLADIYVECKSPIVIFASRTFLKTVFENLIDNSIKYKKEDMPRAAITVSCYEELDGRRRYVSVSFKDEGIGMDEEQADRCFYLNKSTGE